MTVEAVEAFEAGIERDILLMNQQEAALKANKTEAKEENKYNGGYDSLVKSADRSHLYTVKDCHQLDLPPRITLPEAIKIEPEEFFHLNQTAQFSAIKVEPYISENDDASMVKQVSHRHIPLHQTPALVIKDSPSKIEQEVDNVSQHHKELEDEDMNQEDSKQERIDEIVLHYIRHYMLARSSQS